MERLRNLFMVRQKALLSLKREEMESPENSFWKRLPIEAKFRIKKFKKIMALIRVSLLHRLLVVPSLHCKGCSLGRFDFNLEFLVNPDSI